MKKVMTIIVSLMVTVLIFVNTGCKEPAPDIMPPLDGGVKGILLEVA